MRVSSESRLHADLSKLFCRGTAASDDRALLDRFLGDRDEAAFEALVERHGPMVRGVCRRLLTDSHDEDDAFQATFLVLVRKAGRLRDSDRLGPWLYGVASRVATKARTRKLRRRERPQLAVEEIAAPQRSRTDLLDVLPIFDAELARTSTKLRDVLILCLLEGATPEEASHQLGCPVGTVKSRLARGRAALRDRLTRRGISPTLALAATSATRWTAPVPASLTRATLAAITGTSPGIAPGVATLLRGAAPAMISKPTVMIALILGTIALVGLGTATWTQSPAIAQQPKPAEARPDVDRPPAAKKAHDESRDHVKTIGLAFQNYLLVHGQLPPAANLGTDAAPLLSWRVALLPFLGETALYNEFRQSEPWDSPHNKALIARMPSVYQTPDSPAPAGQTRFRGFRGQGTVFEVTRGVMVEEITDGLENTLLFVSAAEPTIWTRPGELPYAADRNLPALAESETAGWLIGMGDGSALEISRNSPMLLRNLITRNAGEVITWPHGGTSTPVPPTPSAVEVRLQRVEEKLDRLLEKLSAQPGPGKP